MRFGVVAGLAIVALLAPVIESTSLKVASFNIQIFGTTKVKNQEVMDVITKIISRYDIVLIQEIRDATNKVVNKLVDALNKMGDETWDAVVSERLGRTSSKEQYAFLYKPDVVEVRDQYQWPDTTDAFEREPFIVHFSPKKDDIDITDFAFMGVHIKPDDAPREINKLAEVYNSVSKMWDLQDMVIGGDFNADCSYVDKKDWKTISLRNDPRFLWTISDGVDTTMTGTDCAYDRLIVAGKNLQKDYVKDSATVFKFDEEFGLSQELALKVSDHYPVELTLS